MQLHSPKNLSVRPTTDKVRQAIFSSLFDEIKDANVLDLCAGTGSFGLEAVSRGASSAVLIDLSIDIAKKNILDSKLKNVKLIKGDVKKELTRLNAEFDIIFIDPPYGVFEPEEILKIIYENNILAQEGTLIYEESARTFFPAQTDGFRITKERTYGDTVIYYLKRM